MKCPHCGEELPEGFSYSAPESKNTPQFETDNTNKPQEPEITAIAAEIPKSPQVIQNTPIPYTQHSSASKSYKKFITIIASILAVLLIVVGSVFGIRSYNTHLLQKNMEGTWYQTDNMFDTIQLTIAGDTISYTSSFGFMTMNSGSCSYSVDSKKAIKIQGTKHNITFDKTNGTMTVTPGILSNGTEMWYSSDSLQNQQNQQNQQPQNGTDNYSTDQNQSGGTV